MPQMRLSHQGNSSRRLKHSVLNKSINFLPTEASINYIEGVGDIDGDEIVQYKKND